MEPWGTRELRLRGFTQHCYTLVATHQVRSKPLQEAAYKSELVKLLQQAAVHG